MLWPFLRFVEWLCARTLFRRRVRAVLYTTLILGALAIQIALVIRLLNVRRATVTLGDEANSGGRLDFSGSPTWRAIRDVLETARSVRLPVFALEAAAAAAADHPPPKEGPQKDNIATANIGRRTDEPACTYFCSGSRFQFGTIAAFSNRREPQFVEQLLAKGFDVDTVRVPNPNMVELIVELTAHFVIRYTGPTSELATKNDSGVGKIGRNHRAEIIIIHIMVFHDRPDNFWWHAPVPLGHPLRRSVDGLAFVDAAGAHPKTEIVEGVRDGLRTLLPSVSFRASVEFIDCNRTHAEEFFAKNGGRDSSPNSELFRIRVRKLLLKVKSLLAKHSIPFWLSSGTCLGWFRQCDVIPYTTDVDIGVFIEDFRPAMIDEFSTHDLALTHVFGHPGDSYELSFLDVAEQLKLDVFFFYRESNHTWNGGTQARTGHKYKYVFQPFSMCLTEFLDLLVQVPCPTLPYILANYGADWRRPVRHWDWKRSPPNVRENGVWPMEQWSRLIQLFPLPPY